MRRLAPSRPGRATLPAWVRVLALGLVVAWLGLAGVGGPRIGQLSGLQENDSTAFLPPEAESSIARAEAAAFADADSLPLFLVLTRADGVGPDQFAALGAFVQGLPAVDLGDGLTMSDVVTTEPAALIPSDDGEAVLVPIALASDEVREKVGESTVLRTVIDALAHTRRPNSVATASRPRSPDRPPTSPTSPPRSPASTASCCWWPSWSCS